MLNKKKFTCKLKIRYAVVLISIFYLSIGCSEGKRSNYSEPVESDLQSMEEEIPDSMVFNNDIKIIPLETTPESIVSKINRVYMDNGMLFILDRRQEKVLVFSEKGKYILHIYRKGKGPGEYDQISDIDLDLKNKKIMILCDRPNKIIFYDYKGKFIDEMNTSRYYSEAIISGEDLYAYCSGIPGSVEKNEKNQIDIINLENEKTIGSFLPQFTTEALYKYSTMGNFMNSSRNVLLSRKADNRIYEIANHGIRTKYKFNFKNHKLPDHIPEIEDFIDYTVKNEYIYTLTDALETDNWLMFQTNLGTFVMDQKDRKLRGYRSGVVNTAFSFPLNRYTVLGGSKKNQVAFIVSSDIIKRLEKNRLQRRAVDVNTPFLKFAKNVHDSDNPIVFLYTIK